jgi:hypothetical protein
MASNGDENSSITMIKDTKIVVAESRQVTALGRKALSFQKR